MLSSLHLLSELTTEDLTDCHSSTRTEKNSNGDEHEDDTITTGRPAQEHGDVATVGAVVSSAAMASGVASIRYDRHKPKWWKQRSGRYVTKPQRRALEAMESHRIAKPPHGQVLDFDSIFRALTRTHDGTAEEKEEAAPSQKQVWMELGFGKGDNLLCLAHRNPDALFIGVEVHPSSIAICLQRIQQSIERNEAWDEYQLYSESEDPFHSESVPCDGKRDVPAEVPPNAANALQQNDEKAVDESIISPSPSDTPYQNVRVYGGDGIVLLENGVAPSSLDVILITFPDPFPSDKPHRIFQVHTVSTMVRRLKPSGRLLLATDHQGFYDWAIDVVNEWNAIQGQMNSAPLQVSHEAHHPRLVPIPNIDRRHWLPVVSRYERKGWDEGRRTLVAVWKKK
jgi:tRNA G46 methylase TrmB